MKRVLVAFCILISLQVNAQKCNLIKNNYDELADKTSIFSQYTVINMACSMAVARTIDHKNNSDSAFIYLKIGTTGRCLSAKGVLIKFEDGNEIREVDQIGFTGYEYGNYCAAFFAIKPSQLEWFKKSKIKKIQIDQFAVDVNSRYSKDFIKFIDCVYSAPIKNR